MVRFGRLIAAACFVLLTTGSARATSYTYVGLAPTGQQTDWNNSQNWSPNGVPTANDDATIDSASSSFFPVLTSEVTIKNLTIRNGGSITGRSVTVNGLLTMAGGGFVSSIVSANGGITISSGGAGFGNATLRGGQLINFGGEQTPATLTSGGLTLSQNGSEPAQFYNSGVFIIGGGARIERQGQNDTSTFFNSLIFRSNLNLNGVDVGSVVAAKNHPFFVNDGIVDIGAGTLTFDAVVQNRAGELRTNTSALPDGTIKVAGGARLELGESPSSKITGPGMVEVNGRCTVLGDIPAVNFRLKSIAGAGSAELIFASGARLTVSDTFEWQAGIIDITQNATKVLGLEVVKTLNISGNNVQTKAFVRNRGTATLSSGAKITGNNAPFFNPGTLNIVGGQFDGSGSFLTNDTTGTIRHVSGQTTFGWELISQGNVEAQLGTIAFTGRVTSNKTFTAAANTTIEFNNFTDFNAARLEGAGLFRASGSSTIRVFGDVPVARFEFNGSSKTFTGTGRLIVSNLFDWKAGTMECDPAGPAQVVIEPGATFNVSGDSKTNVGCDFFNSGIMNVDTFMNLDNDADVNNQGQLNLNRPFSWDLTDLPPDIINDGGVVNIAAPGTTVNNIVAPYTQLSGTTNLAPNVRGVFWKLLNIEGGSFNAGNGSTTQVETGTQFNFTSGSFTTDDTHTIIAPTGINITGASVSPGDNGGAGFGVINIPFGPLNISPIAQMNFGVGGPVAGTQHDQVNVSSSATLGGTANIQLSNGFTPADGSVIQLMRFDTRTNTFRLINGLNTIGNSRFFQPRYTNTDFSIVLTNINASQNGPVIDSAVTTANGTTVQGGFNAPAGTYTIFLFTNPPGSGPTCDNANQSLVGTTTVTTNGSTAAAFTINPASPIPAGSFVTAIASATGSNTASNFSACTQVTGSGSTVQFSAALFSAGEGGSAADVTITRAGNSAAAASINFATSDAAAAQNCNVFNANASSRCDYITSLSRVEFAPGETSKTLSVPLVDDSYAEGDETFTVTLSDPSGASLGAQSTATVRILDNESVAGPNPIDQAGFFVRQHYLDFLNRQPDASGLAFWTNEITSCGADQACIEVKRINVSAAFYLSIEFQDTGYLVERLYKTAYGDATGSSTLGGPHQLSVPVIRLIEFLPDTQRVGRGVVVNQPGWEALLENNKQAFINEFVQRSRFLTAFPSNTTPAQFVATLNNNAGNPLSQLERDQLAAELASGAKTRAQVLRAVAEHPNLVRAEFNRAFVLMQFFGYLRRNPNDPQDNDYTGYDFWLSKLNEFNGNFVNAEMVKAFISSAEYRQRLGP